MPGRYRASRDLFGGFTSEEATAPGAAGAPVVVRKPEPLDRPFSNSPSWEVKCKCGHVFLCIARHEPKDSRCSVCMGLPGAFIPAGTKFNPFTRTYILPEKSRP